MKPATHGHLVLSENKSKKKKSTKMPIACWNTCPGIYLEIKLVLSLHPLISSIFQNLASKWYTQGRVKSNSESLSPPRVLLCAAIHSTDPFLTRTGLGSVINKTNPRNKDTGQESQSGGKMWPPEVRPPQHCPMASDVPAQTQTPSPSPPIQAAAGLGFSPDVWRM